MGIDSNCKVIATSTHSPTPITDDHFQYMPIDLAGFLLPQAVDAMTAK